MKHQAVALVPVVSGGRREKRQADASVFGSSEEELKVGSVG